MAQEVLALDNSIRITSERLTFGDGIYTTDAVKSAKLQMLQANSNLWQGLAILWAALPAMMWIRDSGFDSLVVGILGLLWALLFAIGLALVLTFRPLLLYAVKLEGTFGRALVFISTDKAQVQRIVGVINETLDSLPVTAST